jgi:hypothetical protein
MQAFHSSVHKKFSYIKDNISAFKRCLNEESVNATELNSYIYKAYNVIEELKEMLFNHEERLKTTAYTIHAIGIGYIGIYVNSIMNDISSYQLFVLSDPTCDTKVIAEYFLQPMFVRRIDWVTSELTRIESIVNDCMYSK